MINSNSSRFFFSAVGVLFTSKVSDLFPVPGQCLYFRSTVYNCLIFFLSLVAVSTFPQQGSISIVITCPSWHQFASTYLVWTDQFISYTTIQSNPTLLPSDKGTRNVSWCCVHSLTHSHQSLKKLLWL